MVDDVSPAPTRSSRFRPRWLGAACAALLAGAVLYGLLTPGKEAGGACAASAAAAARLDPLVGGEVAALSVARAPRPMADLAFQGEGGAPKRLSDFRGRLVLVNLWATWCVPCRKEMPALDRLQADLGGPGFQVVAINVDTARLDRPQQFLREVGATHLPFYADPSGAVLGTARQDGTVLGLPTTILVDRDGCALASMAGPADWASPAAHAVIAAAGKG